MVKALEHLTPAERAAHLRELAQDFVPDQPHVRRLLTTTADHLEDLWGQVQHGCSRCAKRDAAGATAYLRFALDLDEPVPRLTVTRENPPPDRELGRGIEQVERQLELAPPEVFGWQEPPQGGQS